MGKSDFSQLKAFQEKLESLGAGNGNMQQFYEDAAKELAARFLAKVIKRTPVGDYHGDEYVTKTGKVKYRKYKSVNFTTNEGKTVTFKAKISKQGGTLRRGWTAKTESEAESGGTDNPQQFAQSIEVEKVGRNYQITIINPVHYASYVEYGHRTRGGKGWVNGQFMMTISEKEMQSIAPKVLERKFELFLREVLA